MSAPVEMTDDAVIDFDVAAAVTILQRIDRRLADLTALYAAEMIKGIDFAVIETLWLLNEAERDALRRVVQS